MAPTTMPSPTTAPPPLPSQHPAAPNALPPPCHPHHRDATTALPPFAGAARFSLTIPFSAAMVRGWHHLPFSGDCGRRPWPASTTTSTFASLLPSSTSVCSGHCTTEDGEHDNANQLPIQGNSSSPQDLVIDSVPEAREARTGQMNHFQDKTRGLEHAHTQFPRKKAYFFT